MKKEQIMYKRLGFFWSLKIVINEILKGAESFDKLVHKDSLNPNKNKETALCQSHFFLTFIFINTRSSFTILFN